MGELRRAAWAGVFDTFGEGKADKGALIIVALGPQPNALGEVLAPPNSMCLPSVPQVDILNEGVELFLTHGGQNSFTEALANAVPSVVCPGFGDQPANGYKAVRLGVGLCIERPEPRGGEEAKALSAYRKDVASALHEVYSHEKYKAVASSCSTQLQQAGGVPESVKVILEAAHRRPNIVSSHGGA